jgi:ABC-type nitrate/sulfonate/bicarbonate transport system substrate-binding protein
LEDLKMRALSLKPFAGLLCSLSLASVTAGTSPAQAAELKKLPVVAVAPTSLFWPLYIADENGLYKDKGLDVALTFSGSATGPMQLLIAGEVDIAVTTSDVGIDAVSRGAKVKLIAGYLSSRPFIMMAKPDIKTVEQLKGKAVGVSPPRDISTIAWNRWLKSQNIKPSEIDQIYNTNTGARYAALSNGATVAAMLSPPVSFKAKKAGYNEILDMGEYLRGVPFLCIFARTDWLESHGDVARAFLTTQSEAIDWFYDTSHRKQANDILARRIKMDRPLIEETYDYYINQLKPFSRKLVISEEGYKNELESLIEADKIKSVSAIPADFNDARFRPK